MKRCSTPCGMWELQIKTMRFHTYQNGSNPKNDQHNAGEYSEKEEFSLIICGDAKQYNNFGRVCYF